MEGSQGTFTAMPASTASSKSTIHHRSWRLQELADPAAIWDVGEVRGHRQVAAHRLGPHPLHELHRRRTITHQRSGRSRASVGRGVAPRDELRELRRGLERAVGGHGRGGASVGLAGAVRCATQAARGAPSWPASQRWASSRATPSRPRAPAAAPSRRCRSRSPRRSAPAACPSACRTSGKMRTQSSVGSAPGPAAVEPGGEAHGKSASGSAVSSPATSCGPGGTPVGGPGARHRSPRRPGGGIR